MLFVMTMTLWSLTLQAGWAFQLLSQKGFLFNATFANGIICLLLILLACMMIVEGIRKSTWPERVSASAAGD
jgi:hypothetical protein